jgi:hypothetical protein
VEGIWISLVSLNFIVNKENKNNVSFDSCTLSDITSKFDDAEISDSPKKIKS